MGFDTIEINLVYYLFLGLIYILFLIIYCKPIYIYWNYKFENHEPYSKFSRKLPSVIVNALSPNTIMTMSIKDDKQPSKY